MDTGGGWYPQRQKDLAEHNQNEQLKQVKPGYFGCRIKEKLGFLSKKERNDFYQKYVKRQQDKIELDQLCEANGIMRLTPLSQFANTSDLTDRASHSC